MKMTFTFKERHIYPRNNTKIFNVEILTQTSDLAYHKNCEYKIENVFLIHKVGIYSKIIIRD